VIKDVTKDDEEIHRGCLGGSWAPVPLESVGCATSPAGSCAHHPGSSPNASTFGILMEAFSRRLDQSLSPFPAPLPFLEDGGVGLNIPSF